VAPSSPAALCAEVFPGDAIVKINKTDTRSLRLEDVQALLRGSVGTPVNIFIRRLGGDPQPACIALEFARNYDRSSVVAHGGAVVAAQRPASARAANKDGSKLSEMRLLQSQVLGQLGVRKSSGYTGQQDFLKRRHGLGRCVRCVL
jgi:membrane-associated protease RseP (regulator of RpoE activity)